MKKTIYLLLLLTGVALLPGCKKDEVKIDASNLTPCPDGAECLNLFTESARLDSNRLMSGPYRVFWHTELRPGMTSQLNILAPMKGKSFSYGNGDIKNKVTFRFTCPACSYILMEPVGGFVKGINTTPNLPSDRAKWLVEANIIMEAAHDAAIKDTLYVKQYYSANFVLN